MPVTEISAKDAFAILKNDPKSVLIDVRTNEEINFVGFVDPSEIDDRAILLPWKLFPDMRVNPQFTSSLNDSLKKLLSENILEAKLFFMCRSGARSEQAAYQTSTLGFQNCYNITSGFEGDIDYNGHRGNVNGWKASKLPWKQS